MDFLSKWLDNDAATTAITASTGNNLGLQKAWQLCSATSSFRPICPS